MVFKVTLKLARVRHNAFSRSSRVCHGHFFARAACFLRRPRPIFQIDLLLTWADPACLCLAETPRKSGADFGILCRNFIFLCRDHAAYSHLVWTTPNMRARRRMSIATDSTFPFLEKHNWFADRGWTKIKIVGLV